MKALRVLLLTTLPVTAMHVADPFRFNNLKVETLLDNGSPRNHVDIVILGDGYTKDDLGTGGAFARDASEAMDAVFRAAPFGVYKQLFNVYAVYAESFDRGAEDRPGDDKLRNIFDCRFQSNPNYLLVPARPENVMRIAKNAPAADIVLVMVNDPRYGGSGGVIWERIPAPCFSTAAGSIEVAVHELGHSFAGLADEYADPMFALQNPLPTGKQDLPHPNVTLARFVDISSPEKFAGTVKWKHFLTLPGADRVIGAHEGGFFRPRGVYRPQERCKMRDVSDPFCHVCREAIARAIHAAAQRRFDDAEYHRLQPIAMELMRDSERRTADIRATASSRQLPGLPATCPSFASGTRPCRLTERPGTASPPGGPRPFAFSPGVVTAWTPAVHFPGQHAAP